MRYSAWISTSVLQQIADDAHRWFPSETGGTLLGYWARPTEVVITTCTTAGPLARHTGTLYVPDPDHDEQAIAAYYHASGRLHTYLGDWHTHPRHAAYLSAKDTHTLHQIALEPEARTRTPLMLIAGGGPTEWRPNIWCYRRFLGRKRIPPMIIKAFPEDC
jgi:integrative and conjugative element protein (TIGR02256 family)